MTIRSAFAAAALAGGLLVGAAPALAAFPVYSTPGTESPIIGNYFSASNGSVKVWFAGSGSAAYESVLGVKVNGVDRGLGLSNQVATPGQLFNFGPVSAGDSLEFYLNVLTTGLTFSSNKASNADGVSHIFSTAYAGGDFGIPAGTYFGFEDLENGGDFNYQDYQFVVLNRELPAVPEPATWAMMIIGFGVIGASMRSRRHNVKVSYS